MDLQAIRAFVPINEQLATAGQPTEEQLTLLEEHGFSVVINLGLLDPKYCLPDEAASVAALGLAYHHVPVVFTAPTLADYQAFERVMREARGSRVFVHCAANYRVSCFVALYAEAELGWSRSRADEHIRRLWEPNAVWSEFLEAVRAKRVER